MELFAACVRAWKMKERKYKLLSRQIACGECGVESRESTNV